MACRNQEMAASEAFDLRCLCGNAKRAKSSFDGRCRHHHHQQRKPAMAHRVQWLSLRLRYGGHRRALFLQESQFQEVQVPAEGETKRQAHHRPDRNTIFQRPDGFMGRVPTAGFRKTPRTLHYRVPKQLLRAGQEKWSDYLFL